ncbi:hypothetical protein [Nonlabens xiamenensis]|uniref:hypothetical protein n=1 Tax=Nonlabens xiamenensis TaxID=2341043 RepID=UPI000F613E0D|nr:hypothetical protein [Nonlabens xiamenensis]
MTEVKDRLDSETMELPADFDKSDFYQDYITSAYKDIIERQQLSLQSEWSEETIDSLPFQIPQGLALDSLQLTAVDQAYNPRMTGMDYEYFFAAQHYFKNAQGQAVTFSSTIAIDERSIELDGEKLMEIRIIW